MNLREFVPRVMLVLWCLCGAISPATGATWNIVSSPNPSTSGNELKAVAAISATDAWAVGDYESSYGTLSLIEHWNGLAWKVVTSPNPGVPNQCGHGNVLNGVAARNTRDVWAVGYYYSCSLFKTLIEHWNGTKWSVVPSPSPNSQGYNVLYSVAAISANDVWAVGYAEKSNGAPMTLIEHWDGSSWSVVPSPNPSGSTNASLLSVAAVSATNIWAVGTYFNSSKGRNETLIEHSNGRTWTIVPSPNPSSAQWSRNILNSVSVVSATDIWAAGTTGYPTLITLVEHWNGTKWSVVSSPNSSTAYGSFNVLNGITIVPGGKVWAVGYFGNANTSYYQHRTLTLQWNGTSWSIVTSPSPGKAANLSAVAPLSTGKGVAVGLYSVYGNDYYGNMTAPATLVLSY